MSEEKLELLRPVLAEWAKGNFWAGPELLAPDVTFRAAMPANFVAYGLEETALRMLEVLEEWSDYRIEAEELEDLGEDTVLAAGRQRGTGKLSGAEADYPIFVLFEFRGDEVIGVYLEGTRDAALKPPDCRSSCLDEKRRLAVFGQRFPGHDAGHLTSVLHDAEHDLAVLAALCDARESGTYVLERENRVDRGLEVSPVSEPRELDQLRTIGLYHEILDPLPLLCDRDDARAGLDRLCE